ncbi:MAG TPA: aldo/keto reductase [Sphingomicrobium sp.]|nr:aldo/keto reductase [Sphingomicrobium sp.]
MEYVTLGKSGIRSSVIGLGGGSSGRFGLKNGGSRADAVRLIRLAVDEGITFFDGAGLAGGVDDILGKALADCRDRVLISTKVHLGPAPVVLTGTKLANRASAWVARHFGTVCSARTLRHYVERTLRVLRVERIDLLSLHSLTPNQYPLAIERALPELARMKEEGKIRAIGVTEGFLSDPGHAMLRAAVADARFDAVMIGFNLANRSAAKAILPAATEAGMGTIGMFVLRGLSAPTYRDGTVQALPDRLAALLGEAGIGRLAGLAYRYCRHQQGVDVVLTGTGNPVHLRENIAAALAPPLTGEALERLHSILDIRSEGS